MLSDSQLGLRRAKASSSSIFLTPSGTRKHISSSLVLSFPHLLCRGLRDAVCLQQSNTCSRSFSETIAPVRIQGTVNSGHKRALPSFTPGLLKVEGKSAKAQQRDPLNRQLAAIKQTKFYIPLASFKKIQDFTFNSA